MTFKKRQARLALALVLFILPLALLGTSQPRRLTFGVYGGWSQGLGYEFGWHSRPSRSDDYTLDAHLGAYIQYNLSAVFSIQANMNYQHGTNPWTFTYPGWPYDEGTDMFSIVSANLNGVITLWRLKRISFYFLGGGGINRGEWEAFWGTYFNLTAGAGVKVYISSSHPNLALNIGGIVVHLIEPDKYGDDTAQYLRFLIGIEF
ncbi:MAG TPA: hypothetical protein DIW61_02800 [Candidatus Aminicenantes bacterium]|nr:hypothetical protein [Candidatus Aminicenantes bacterium]